MADSAPGQRRAEGESSSQEGWVPQFPKRVVNVDSDSDDSGDDFQPQQKRQRSGGVMVAFGKIAQSQEFAAAMAPLPGSPPKAPHLMVSALCDVMRVLDDKVKEARLPGAGSGFAEFRHLINSAPHVIENARATYETLTAVKHVCDMFICRPGIFTRGLTYGMGLIRERAKTLRKVVIKPVLNAHAAVRDIIRVIEQIREIQFRASERELTLAALFQIGRDLLAPIAEHRARRMRIEAEGFSIVVDDLARYYNIDRVLLPEFAVKFVEKTLLDRTRLEVVFTEQSENHGADLETSAFNACLQKFRDNVGVFEDPLLRLPLADVTMRAIGNLLSRVPILMRGVHWDYDSTLHVVTVHNDIGWPAYHDLETAYEESWKSAIQSFRIPEPAPSEAAAAAAANDAVAFCPICDGIACAHRSQCAGCGADHVGDICDERFTAIFGATKDGKCFNCMNRACSVCLTKGPLQPCDDGIYRPPVVCANLACKAWTCADCAAHPRFNEVECHTCRSISE